MENNLIISHRNKELEFYNEIGYPLFDMDKNEIISGKQFDDALGYIVDSKPTVKQLQSGKFKISVITWWVHTEEEIARIPDVSYSDLVICMTSELPGENFKEYHENTCRLLKNKNVIYIMNGKEIDEIYPEDIFFCPNLYFFKTVVAGNDPLIYTSDKRPFLFDALLGSKKLHKLKIFDFFKESQLLEKCIVSLKDGPHHPKANLPEYTYETPNLYRLEDPMMFNYKNNPYDDPFLNYLGRNSEKTFKNSSVKMWASNIISHRIYQNSWYSFVCETNVERFHFLTEKTAKCLFAKRIFILFASHGTLQFLRDQGFKTFDGIIDESYDKEIDTNNRMHMVFDQMLWLSKQDPVKMYQLAKPILDHNYKTMIKSDLNASAMRKFIEKNINRIKNENCL